VGTRKETMILMLGVPCTVNTKSILIFQITRTISFCSDAFRPSKRPLVVVDDVTLSHCRVLYLCYLYY
jgi:hypothetical protein